MTLPIGNLEIFADEIVELTLCFFYQLCVSEKIIRLSQISSQLSQPLRTPMENSPAALGIAHVFGQRERQFKNLLQPGNVPFDANIGRGMKQEILRQRARQNRS